MTLRTALMGIVNVTPNSFSDGGKYMGVDAAFAHAIELTVDGASIIDVGGESAGPGAPRVSLDEEWRRVGPVLGRLAHELPDDVALSIDTRRAEVARRAIDSGAKIVNCSGALDFDVETADVVAASTASIVLFDLPVDPESMRPTRRIGIDRVADIIGHLGARVDECVERGIPLDRIIVDPGLGYPHDPLDNVRILTRLREFERLRCPILVGPSRKQHLGLLMQTVLSLDALPVPTERVEAGLAEIALAVSNGASIIRTHDVREARDFLALWETILDMAVQDEANTDVGSAGS